MPGEGTLVSFCKQGRLSACQELARVNPRKSAEIQAELARAALRREALKAAEEEDDGRGDESSESEATGAVAEASAEPPDCKGQEHHIISRPIAEALERHQTLSGLYKPRDKRFKTRAKDTESHCGYQDWHRQVDAEVIDWLEKFPNASPEQFLEMLRKIYSRPKMLERFPHGF